MAGATVSFAGVPAASVTVVNPTSLTAKPPAHSVGLVTVSVTNPNSQTGGLPNAYAYLAASGQLAFQYFPITVPDVAVTDIAAGPDGNLWFLTNGGESLNPDGLAKMTPSGTFTNYPLVDPGLLRDITPGPDGNVWYVRQRPDKIGRITPSGVATEFSNVSGRSYEGIAAGPDGAMWFTESLVNIVGRITTIGAFTEFIVSNFAYGITLGADGNLWLAGCYSSSPVCTRVLPGGQYQNFPIPNPVAGLCPRKIVAGPDGNLWFQYGSGLKVGRLTTAGAYTEFELPSGIDVHDIAAAVDGNLWATYSDYVDAWVSRITPFGEITEFPLPFGSIPRGIVAGPDGAIWFANGSNIGRINPGAYTPPPASFFTVEPCRVVDTRDPAGPFGGPSLASGTDRAFTVIDQCGIPPGAKAISVNLVVTQSTFGGFVTLYPGGSVLPLAATLNYGVGQTRGNNAIVPLGSAGDVVVRCTQPAGTAEFVLDVNGYFQ